MMERQRRVLVTSVVALVTIGVVAGCATSTSGQAERGRWIPPQTSQAGSSSQPTALSGSEGDAADGTSAGISAGPSAAPSSDPKPSAPEPSGAPEPSTSGDDSGTPGPGSESPGNGSQSAIIDLSGDTQRDLTIPIPAGWSEDIALTNLYRYALEKRGFTVETPTMDIGPIFQGVADGDYDFFFDTWLPNTHASYWQQYEDDVVDFGAWYDSAPLTIAVPDYMDIDSLADLRSIGDEVDKTITGIDPGAGLTDVTQNSMMPAYGLDDWTLDTTSTAAMLASLTKAISNKDPIVVTLWHPHWAYGAFPIKDLADPKGAMGQPDSIHAIGSRAFTSADPGLAALLNHFVMTPEQLESLMAATVRDPNMSSHEIRQAAATWADNHPDFMTAMFG